LEPSDRIYKTDRDMEPLPWSERDSGPVWIWVMDIKKESAGVVDVTICLDVSWTSKVRFQKNTRGYGGVGVDTVTVSLLDHYPDGKRWKVTDYNPLTGDPANRPYTPSCKAWGKTHTTTEGWTLLPESPDSVDPAP
jgi:hypothetical protein